jgi:hypothetical protein
MMKCEEQYLIDEGGNSKAVAPTIWEWMRIDGDLEELDDIRAYDHANRTRQGQFLSSKPSPRSIKGPSIEV